jgi:hypothetical protein
LHTYQVQDDAKRAALIKEKRRKRTRINERIERVQEKRECFLGTDGEDEVGRENTLPIRPGLAQIQNPAMGPLGSFEQFGTRKKKVNKTARKMFFGPKATLFI